MRELSTKYKRIAKRIIDKRDELSIIQDFDIRVAFVESDEAKKKNHKIVFADCECVPEKWKVFVKYDFVITVYEPNIESFNKKQIEILLLHELLHIGVNTAGNEPKFYAVPHDVEEFDLIIKEYGMRWEEGVTNAER